MTNRTRLFSVQALIELDELSDADLATIDDRRDHTTMLDDEGLADVRAMLRRLDNAPVGASPESRRPWADDAACSGEWELMGATDGPEVIEALKLCASCPVLDACRAWVATETMFEGVAGGDLHTRTGKARVRLGLTA